MRYCTEDAFFTIKETELGMTADLGTLQRLPQLNRTSGLSPRTGLYRKKNESVTKLNISGLVNCVYPDGEERCLEGVTAGLLKRLLLRSPLAVTGCKQMINYARDHSVADSLSYMATWQAGMFQPVDMMQTFSAKMSGQPAKFEPLRKIVPPLQKP